MNTDELFAIAAVLDAIKDRVSVYDDVNVAKAAETNRTWDALLVKVREAAGCGDTNCPFDDCPEAA